MLLKCGGVEEKMVIFVVLLGVSGACRPAEMIPYEPDMYNNSAGKRCGIRCLSVGIRAFPLG